MKEEMGSNLSCAINPCLAERRSSRHVAFGKGTTTRCREPDLFSPNVPRRRTGPLSMHWTDIKPPVSCNPDTSCINHTSCDSSTQSTFPIPADLPQPYKRVERCLARLDLPRSIQTHSWQQSKIPYEPTSMVPSTVGIATYV